LLQCAAEGTVKNFVNEGKYSTLPWHVECCTQQAAWFLNWHVCVATESLQVKRFESEPLSLALHPTGYMWVQLRVAAKMRMQQHKAAVLSCSSVRL
jgi:hypothetical protein